MQSEDGRLDSLLTLVLKIDLGGICSSNHLFKPILDEFGICENWIDKILSTVANIKQRLETPQIEVRILKNCFLKNKILIYCRYVRLHQDCLLCCQLMDSLSEIIVFAVMELSLLSF